MTSSVYVVDLKGNTFGRIICPPSFVVIALIFSELRGGDRISASLPVSEDPEKPGLNRVNVCHAEPKAISRSLYGFPAYNALVF